MEIIDNETFKVVKIISEREIVINAGSEKGFSVGDIFEIFVQGSAVYDPDTQEDLGNLDFVKARIAAKVVLPKMSVCENAASVNVFSTLGNLLWDAPALDVDSAEISGGFLDINRKIVVGDLVRIVRKNSTAVSD